MEEHLALLSFAEFVETFSASVPGGWRHHPEEAVKAVLNGYWLWSMVLLLVTG
jgi:hypothetical protein